MSNATRQSIRDGAAVAVRGMIFRDNCPKLVVKENFTPVFLPWPWRLTHTHSVNQHFR